MVQTTEQAQPAAVHEALYTDGIVAERGAFAVDWVDRLAADVDAAYDEARGRDGGAVSRGPHRWYVEVHPEAISGFAALVGHPWVQMVCATVLGPEWTVVEVGFDVPLAGAVTQPWHRDFPMPAATRDDRRLTSLAFNISTVDTAEDMGPFEIAPGTQFDDGTGFDHEMFPLRTAYERYEQRAQRKYPQRGDISARSALTIHRGTTNHSPRPRPVLVLGVDAPGAGNDAHHDLAMTPAYAAALPRHVRRHLSCPVLDRLQPIVQKHTIEGLVMGDPDAT